MEDIVNGFTRWWCGWRNCSPLPFSYNIHGGFTNKTPFIGRKLRTQSWNSTFSSISWFALSPIRASFHTIDGQIRVKGHDIAPKHRRQYEFNWATSKWSWPGAMHANCIDHRGACTVSPAIIASKNSIIIAFGWIIASVDGIIASSSHSSYFKPSTWFSLSECAPPASATRKIPFSHWQYGFCCWHCWRCRCSVWRHFMR